MNKIEELAKQFTDELFAGDDLTDFDTQTEKNDAYVTCIAFGNHLMSSLPLTSRMTEEEKERVRKMYKAEKEHVQYQMRQANASMNQMCRSWHNQLKEGSYAKLRLLESIFGKELFERKEEV